MVSADRVARGDIVQVTFPDSPRESRDARVVKVPPYEDRHRGVIEDEVEVEYPNTTSRMTLMGDLRESVPLENVHC